MEIEKNDYTAEKIAVIYNANRTSAEVTLPVDGAWKLVVNGQNAGTESLQVIEGDKVTVPALSAYVLIMGEE
ncbi:MAG TPA: alpha amylase C-terminal domain-containing protein [Bacillaceae bacterium]